MGQGEHGQLTGDAQQVVDAIRMALLGGKDDQTRVRVIEAIVDGFAPPPDHADTVSVKIFVAAIEDAGGQIVVPAQEGDN